MLRFPRRFKLPESPDRRLWRKTWHIVHPCSVVAMFPQALVPRADGAMFTGTMAPGPAAAGHHFAHLPRTPPKQASAARGTLQVVRASTAAFQFEWEAYRAESNFHHRTLKFMHQLLELRAVTKTFKQEWDLYRAEWMAQVVGPYTLTGSSKVAKVMQAAAAALAEDAAIYSENELCEGGYHPVRAGETYKDGRYTALHFLGQGHYATVWMVMDHATGEQAAMKVVKSADNYTAAAHDEVRFLTHIRDNDPEGTKCCVRLLDTFEHSGPNGRHVCEVFEALEDDLLALIRLYNFRGIPIPIVRHLMRQTLVALDFLHTKCNILHTDLKPENVVLMEPIRERGAQQSGEAPKINMRELEPRLLNAGCKVVDFGNACWTDSHFSDEIQTRQYRAPEVIVGSGYGESADMWSLACLVFELVTGNFLFHPLSRDGEYGEDEDHLAQMIELLQHIPPEIATAGKHSAEFFTPEGELRHIRTLRYWPLERVLQEKYGMPAEEALALRDFLLPMLHFDPSKRATAAEMLRHPWLRGEVPQHFPLPPNGRGAAAGGWNMP